MLQPGDPAPDFRIGERSLYDILKERSAVVFFYPRAFTPGCTKEVGGFHREFHNLSQSGCDVVGISKDSQEVNDRFRASLDLPYPLVGDPDGTLCRAYRVLWPVIGRTKRVTYIISRQGRVRFGFHDEFGFDEHASKMCEVLGKGG
jgi:thioredoxin-dependent peroxiredoxin